MKVFHYWILIVSFIIFPSQQQSEDLDRYLQSNNQTEFADRRDKRSCMRECVRGDSPRICYYRFVLEDYSVLSRACENCTTNVTQCYNPQCVTADGFQRGITVVNRMLPGPSIQVCYGDRIIVDVENEMPARSTTIHWHGIFQRGTPYSDGVPMVTQCPIEEGNTFRYDFYANQPGTFFWHSHDGIQKVDGLQGSLIIRQPNETDIYRSLYDFDLPTHVIVIMDWYHLDADQHFPGLIDTDMIRYGTYYLINGRGRYIDPRNGNKTMTPYAVFRVTQGNRYRFRIIGATCTHCETRVTIQGHRLTLIATDGNEVKPVVVDSLILYSGERYDFILNATNNIDTYWIQVNGYGPCKLSKTHQLAVLQYEGSNDVGLDKPAPIYDDMDVPVEVELNPINATCGRGQNGVCVDQLEAVDTTNSNILTAEPHFRFAMTFGYNFPTVQKLYQNNTYQRYVVPEPDQPDVILWINNIYQRTLPSPILSQRRDIPRSNFCPRGDNGVPVCNTDLCNCFQLLRMPRGSIVEFILIDKSIGGGFNHPFHLHGYAFYVMDMGYLNDSLMNVKDITQLMKKKQLGQSPAPPLKDTIAVPSEGYSVLRIKADNPGYWLFHCHFVFHHVVGMSLVIQVGEPRDYPPVPDGFPKCGNYQPRIAKRGWSDGSIFGSIFNYM